MTQPVPELTPDELIAAAAPVEEKEQEPFALAVLKELSRIANGQRLADFDGHVYFDVDPQVKGKTASVNAHLFPAGGGDATSFSVAVSA